MTEKKDRDPNKAAVSCNLAPRAGYLIVSILIYVTKSNAIEPL